MTQPYPIALTGLAGGRCVVVGGGAVAARKVAGLLDSDAQVVVISPTLQAELAVWHAAGRIEHLARRYSQGDLEGATLVFAATDQRAVNAEVAAEARARGLLHNIADDPAAGTFHTLGALRRGPVLVAIGTGGASPALAALIRRRVAATIGPEYGLLAERLSALRAEIAEQLPAARRAQLWRALASEELLALLRAGDHDQFEARLATLMHDHSAVATASDTHP